MVAAARNSLNTIEQLLLLGANIWIRASNDKTALDWAHLLNHKEAAELIQSYSDQVTEYFTNLIRFSQKKYNQEFVSRVSNFFFFYHEECYSSRRCLYNT